MKINKKVQNGLLLCFYLARAGRAKLEDVSENLNLSVSFLEQIARTLRISGILISVRGPGGGYELNIDTTVFDVMKALDKSIMLTDSIRAGSLSERVEKRALYNTLKDAANSLRDKLSVRIVDAGATTVKSELSQIEGLSDEAAVN